MLRGSRDFISLEEYGGFVRKVVDRRNRLVQEKLEEERPHLRPLPPAPVPEYINHRARVRKWSTIQPFDKLRSRTDLHRALPAHREGGADPAVRRTPGSVLQGQSHRTYGAGKGRAGGPRRLPARHRLIGAQARGLRPVPVPGADVSHHDLSPGIRCAPGMAGRASGPRAAWSIPGDTGWARRGCCWSWRLPPVVSSQMSLARPAAAGALRTEMRRVLSEGGVPQGRKTGLRGSGSACAPGERAADPRGPGGAPLRHTAALRAGLAAIQQFASPRRTKSPFGFRRWALVLQRRFAEKHF